MQEAPSSPEPWSSVLKEVESLILPGCLHWGSPRFHAYYPMGNSYPSMLGEMVAAAIGDNKKLQ